jgi:hypothetical protein
VRDGDHGALAALFLGAFGRPFSAATYRWKLQARAQGLETAWVAEGADGRLLAHYAGMPMRLQVPWGEAAALVSVDSVTAPDARGHGLCTDLGLQVYAHWRQAGVPLVYGAPNQAWGRQQARLGLLPAFDLRWWVQPLRPEHALASAARVSALRGATALSGAWRRLWDGRAPGLDIDELTAADARFDRHWAAVRPSGYSVIRDAAWVQWRYLDAPGAPYRVWWATEGAKPMGYAVVRLGGPARAPEALLAELSCLPQPGLRRRLLRAVARRLLAQGVGRLATLATPGDAFEADLLRSGFLPRRHAFGFAVATLAEPSRLPGVREAGRWSVQSGDLDVV